MAVMPSCSERCNRTHVFIIKELLTIVTKVDDGCERPARVKLKALSARYDVPSALDLSVEDRPLER